MKFRKARNQTQGKVTSRFTHDFKGVCAIVIGLTVLVGCASTPHPLVDAADQANWTEVKRLLTEGSVIDQTGSRYGRSVLHKAVKQNNQEMVEYLLAQGADIDLGDRSKNTALHIAAWYGDATLIEYLISQKASIQPNRKALTPLHIAAVRGNIEAAKILIKAGADVNAKTLGHRRPLTVALKEGHAELAELLTQHGAKK